MASTRQRMEFADRYMLTALRSHHHSEFIEVKCGEEEK